MADKYDDAVILIRPIVKLECDMDIVEQMRSLESDHDPDGWPAVTMGQVSALCDEIERLRAKLKAAQEQEPVGSQPAQASAIPTDQQILSVAKMVMPAAYLAEENYKICSFAYALLSTSQTPE